jgi:hypothetical protein
VSLFAGMSLLFGFWNTYGMCAGGFEGEEGGWRAYSDLTGPYRGSAAGPLGRPTSTRVAGYAASNV